ncbi:MAG TPA: hypothetical protein PK208_12070 [Fibrobacteria bacterium]|nr:hypothetical protein [Fibrobacteria bacterium]
MSPAGSIGFRPRRVSSRAAGLAVLSLGATASASQWQAGGLVGAGWFTAPSSYSKVEALRPTLVVSADGWFDRGPISVGLLGTVDLSWREGNNYFGALEEESLVLASGVVAVGTTIPLSSVPAKVRLFLGAGAVRSWNELERGGSLFKQESWGPEFRLGGIWEREIGPHGRIRAGLSGVNSWTMESRIQGSDLRSESNWSRVEFCLGWSWSDRR